MRQLKLFLFSPVFLWLVISPVAKADAFGDGFSAFVGGMAMPDEKSTCVAMGKNNMPMFKARRVACGKGASFFIDPNSKKCNMRNSNNDSSHQTMAVNMKYCEASYFDVDKNLGKTNQNALANIKRQRDVSIEP